MLQDKEEILLWAALNNCPTIVKLLVDNGVEIDDWDISKRTALHYAAMGGCESVVELLLDNGACVNAPDIYGRYPIEWAAFGGHTAVVEKMLQNGAKISRNPWESKGLPLHWAAMGGHEPTIRLLLDRIDNDQIDYPDARGMSVLLWLAIGGNEPLLELVLARGADINQFDGQGRGVLHNATDPENLLPYSLERYQLDITDFNSRKLKARCAKTEGCEATINFLLRNGAEINMTTHVGETPLHLAVCCAFESAVRIFLENKADHSYPDNISGLTPLHSAVSAGNEKIVKLLIEAGADVEAESDRETPIGLAVKKGHNSIVTLLLESRRGVGGLALKSAIEYESKEMIHLVLDKGFDAAARQAAAAMAMHTVSRLGQGAIVELLLKRGVDINVKTEAGQTPLHIAAENGREAVARLLIDRGTNISARDAEGQTPLHIAVNKLGCVCRDKNSCACHDKNGQELIVGQLLRRGADIMAVDKNRRTPLHSAAMAGHGPITELLLKCGADISARDAEGQTPLHTAAKQPSCRQPSCRCYQGLLCEDRDRHGQESVVGQLIGEGADIMVVDIYGRTPLHLAAMAGRETIIESLLGNGADIAARDNHGWTPLHWAALSRRPRAIEILLENGADAKIRTLDGRTILHEMAYGGNRKRAQPGSVWQEGWGNEIRSAWSPMSSALKDTTLLLLKAGIDTAAVDDTGRTALWVAFSSGWSLMVGLLRGDRPLRRSRERYEIGGRDSDSESDSESSDE